VSKLDRPDKTFYDRRAFFFSVFPAYIYLCLFINNYTPKSLGAKNSYFSIVQTKKIKIDDNMYMC